MTYATPDRPRRGGRGRRRRSGAAPARGRARRHWPGVVPYRMESTALPNAPAQSGELPRRLGLWSAVAGITIGSGIFRTPASVTNRLPGPLPLFIVWTAGGIVALCGAVTLAEVAA